MSEIPMHRLFNSLYLLQNLITAHLANVEEGIYPDERHSFQKSQEVMKDVEAKLGELTQTIRRLHKLSQPPKEAAASSIEPVSLKEILPQVLESVKKEHPFGEIEFLNRIPDDAPELSVRREELREILFNLMVNALQAMRGKGKLILRACFTRLEGKEPSLTLKVIDTGPGIEREYLHSLFEPFFTTKPETEGNGLGLYIAKELTEKNGGKVTVESFPGHGTTFSLQFPILPSVLSS